MEYYFFLTLEMIEKIHQDSISRYGGSLGVRDQGLLESAIEMPQIGFSGDYIHADIYEMAAAYLFHICKNHPFVDGNKRVAASAAWIFLRMNGYEVNPPEDEFEKLVMEVASGKHDKALIADFFRKYHND